MARPAMSLHIRNHLDLEYGFNGYILVDQNRPHSSIAKSENPVNEVDAGLAQDRRCNVAKVPGVAFLLVAGENHLGSKKITHYPTIPRLT